MWKRSAEPFGQIATWVILAGLWGALVVAAWLSFHGPTSAAVGKQDCLTTENSERADALQRRGYQVVSDEKQPDGSHVLTVCR